MAAHKKQPELQAACLHCGVPDVRCRGLCLACYVHFWRTLREGDLTWSDLEAHGLVAPVPEVPAAREETP
jgi:hypothetical protein